MTDERVSKVTRALGVIVGGGFVALGFAELVTRIDAPLPLLFWLPTLWGGAALVLTGVLVLATRSPAALAVVIAGAFLGTLASFWTIADKGVRDAAAAFDVHVEVMMPTDGVAGQNPQHPTFGTGRYHAGWRRFRI